MPVLDPGRRRTRICQFWAHAMDDRPWGGPSPPAVAYVFADGRGTDEIAGQLADFSGILQGDGYAAYKVLARGHGGAIQLAFCLAHARRKFVEVCNTTSSPFAREVIERLQAIYAIEAEIRGSSAQQRLAARGARTAPLMGIALGRKAWLFAGSDRGGQRAAVMFTLIHTAKLNDVDPQAWLADSLARIADHKISDLAALLPWNWRRPIPIVTGMRSPPRHREIRLRYSLG